MKKRQRDQNLNLHPKRIRDRAIPERPFNLRAASGKFLFKINAFFVTFTVIFDKFSEKIDFFKIFILSFFWLQVWNLRSQFQPR